MIDFSQSFAAGTLCIPFCGLPGSEDSDWVPLSDYRFDWNELAHRHSDSHLVEAVDYLIRTDFVHATVKSHRGRGPRCTGHLTFFRLYIIYADAPGQAALLRSAKQTVLSTRSDLLRYILEQTDVSEDAWNGLEPSSGAKKPFFQHCEIAGHNGGLGDLRTLSRIFQDLPSPCVTGSSLSELSKLRVELVLESSEHAEGIPGLRSTLYKYQAQSVARMLEEESRSPKWNDPTLVPIKSAVEASTYSYLSPAMLLIRRRPEEYTRPQKGASGILAEDPGAGKTIMILALILSSKRDLPVAVPSSPYYNPQISTPALATSFNTRRRDLYQVPSLRDLTLHRARTENVHTFENANLLPDHLAALLENNHPYYMDFYPEPDGLATLNLRKSALHPDEKVFLSPATLLIVPVMLQLQWDAEITKHVEDGVLRVLVVKTKVDIVSVESLASSYDIVLMTYDVFSWAVKCRFPCSCTPASGYCLPALLHICWKRLVIDEGNICGSGVTELVSLLQQVKAENRWIVTGTPTTNLVGGTVEEDPQVDYKMTRKPWTSRDRDDLNKLAYMIGGFLAIPPFHLNEQGGSGISLFKKQIIDPLCHPSGPQFGAVEALSGVMGRVIIRHRARDRARDIALPPMTHETILLDLDKFGAMTYNIMQTVIAVNAVDSEREGPDYLFSPQSVPYLRSLIQNVTQALFWHVDDKVFDLDQAVLRTEEALQKLTDRAPSSNDVQLLADSLQIQRDAAQNSIWRSLMGMVELPYRLDGLSPDVAPRWASATDSSTEALYGASRIIKLQAFASACPSVAHNTASLAAAADALWDTENERSPVAHPSRSSISSSPRKTNKAMAKTGMTIPDASKADRHATAATRAPSRTLAEINMAINVMQSSNAGASLSETMVDLEGVTFTAKHGADSAAVDLTRVRIGPSGSAKLDYILEEVRRYSTDEKFIIFSSGPLTLAHVADGLMLIGTRFLHLSTAQSKNGKEQILTTFKTSDDIRVLLMELKYGARGLNITEASRIIFCEPVWGLDVESQAIKRAHRIGQTRPITVKTLAIRDTFEEEIMKQRTPNSTSKDVCVDDGMRGFLKDPTFISHRPSPGTADFVGGIPLIPALAALHAPPNPPVEAVSMSESSHTDDRPPKRKVAFLDIDDVDVGVNHIDDKHSDSKKKARPRVLRFDV